MKLFHSRSYPTYLLFHYIAQNILTLLSLNDEIVPLISHYAQFKEELIFPDVIKVLSITFDIKYNYGASLVDYLTICKQFNTDKLFLINFKQHSRAPKNLIKTK